MKNIESKSSKIRVRMIIERTMPFVDRVNNMKFRVRRTTRQISFSSKEALEKMHELGVSNVDVEHFTRRILVKDPDKIPNDSIVQVYKGLAAQCMRSFLLNKDKKNAVMTERVVSLSVLPPLSQTITQVPLSKFGYLPGDAIEFKNPTRVTRTPTREVRAKLLTSSNTNNAQYFTVLDGEPGIMMGMACELVSGKGVCRLVYVSVRGKFGWTTLSSIRRPAEQ